MTSKQRATRKRRIDRLLKDLGVRIHEYCGNRRCTTWRHLRWARRRVDDLIKREMHT